MSPADMALDSRLRGNDELEELFGTRLRHRLLLVNLAVAPVGCASGAMKLLALSIPLGFDTRNDAFNGIALKQLLSLGGVIATACTELIEKAQCVRHTQGLQQGTLGAIIDFGQWLNVNAHIL